MMSDFTLMGVLNVTPDSFSDGGQYTQPEIALQQATQMIAEGADIIDIGGESTRPGANPVEDTEEIARILPIVELIRSTHPNQLLSIDTSKVEVMRAAIHAGVGMINDVNALQQKGAVELAAEADIPVCLMHKSGSPADMQNKPEYEDVVQHILDFFNARVDACLDAGMQEAHIILDPGIGFGKTLAHNIQILQNLDVFKQMGFPVLIGISRKSMIGHILDKKVEARLFGSLAAAQFAYLRGADIFRVHDVAATHDVLKVSAALVAQQTYGDESE